MLQSDTPYIVVPMEVMDKLNHQLFIFRANCYPSYLVERACCNAFKDGADFALGKQTETIAQEDIEKAAEAFATPPIGNGGMFTREQVKELLVRFAQLLLSKQEKDANANIKFQKQ